METDNLNLVLKFRMGTNGDCSIRSATRIKVDGQGGLTLYDTETAATENIHLADLQSFSIRFLAGKAA